MSQKERQRYHLLKLVLEGILTLKEASEKMGVSYRHSKRLKKGFLERGAISLIHGNRGGESPKRISEEIFEKIKVLSCGKYFNFNDVHFTEKLNEA